MVRRRLSLPFTDVKEDDEVVADEEINKRKWKSYHEIDVNKIQHMTMVANNYLDEGRPHRQSPIYLTDRPVSQQSSTKPKGSPFPTSRRDLGVQLQGVRANSKKHEYWST